MLCLQLLVGSLLLIRGNWAARRNQPRQPEPACFNERWPTQVPNLEAAMEGFDPLKADPLAKRNPGIRQQIFEPYRFHEDGRVVRNKFIGRARPDLRCTPDFTSITLTSYNQYRSSTGAAYEYQRGADASAENGNWRIDFKYSAGHGREETRAEQDVRLFFQETSGEIILTWTECTTHLVALDPLAQTIFTQGFRNALERLHVAAENPQSAESNSTVREFFSVYGTHYMQEVTLGSKLLFMIRLNNRSADTGEERQRRKCAQEAAFASLEVSMSREAMSAESYFLKAWKRYSEYTDDPCLGSINSVNLVSIGSFPEARVVEMHPVPIACSLDKISSLLQAQGNRPTPHLTGKVANLTKIAHFIESKLDSYCQLMLGRACEESMNHRDIRSLKKNRRNRATSGGAHLDRQACQDDQSSVFDYACSLRHGGVIISGGFNSTAALDTVVSLDHSQLPDLPDAVTSTTLTAVGHQLYSCGGWISRRIGVSGPSENCYKFDSSDQLSYWSRISNLPCAMYGHTAVAVGTHIWFVYSNKVHDLNTDDERFRSHTLPFEVSQHHCAVSNATHSYVLGVGDSRTEIWVNSASRRPDRWQRVEASLSKGRKNFGCLWLGSEVYISGGERVRADVEVLDTITHAVHEVADLKVGRHGHGMMVLHGSPAVMGGNVEDTVGIPSRPSLLIESYNVSTETWTLSTQKLQDGRRNFGLAQLQGSANE